MPLTQNISINKLMFLLCLLLFVATGCKKSKKESGGPADQPDVVISAASILKGPGLTSVTISGSGFSSIVGENKVTFNGVTAVVDVATVTSLSVKVPMGAGTGKIEVKVGEKTATGPVFEYEFVYSVSTFAGQNAFGFTDATGVEAKFAQNPQGMNIDVEGNLYIADTYNNRIRKVSPQGVVNTLLGSAQGYKDGDKSVALFYSPNQILIGTGGTLYIPDLGNRCIRKLTSDGIVSTFAGAAGMSGYVDGQGNLARFKAPGGGVIDAQGNLYIPDISNYRIRKITPGGLVSTFTGSGVAGYLDGAGTIAKFGFANFHNMAIDSKGDFYLSDELNRCIRKITSDGTVSTYAGVQSTALIVDGPLVTARFKAPGPLIFDSKGNLYVADSFRIRKISNDGIVSTIAGNGTDGYTDGKAENALFSSISGLAISPDEKAIYALESSTTGARIRKIAMQ